MSQAVNPPTPGPAAAAVDPADPAAASDPAGSAAASDPAGSPVGSIPAAARTRMWGRRALTNWRVNLLRFVCAGLSVVLTVLITPGLSFRGWHPGEFAIIAVAFGLLNMFLKPALQFLALRFLVSSYGLVVVLINALLLLALGLLMPHVFEVARPLAVIAGALIVGVLGLVLETLLGVSAPILDRDYRERNGLA